MKRIPLAVLLVTSVAFTISGQSENPSIQGTTKDQAAIQKLMQGVMVAWNKHDVVAFSMLFAEDADFTNWRGDIRVHGREAIKEAHAPLFAGMLRKSTWTLKNANIRFFAPNIAVVTCETELTGGIDYDGKGTLPPRTYFPLFVVTKASGKWSIAVMHNVLYQPLPEDAITGPPAK